MGLIIGIFITLLLIVGAIIGLLFFQSKIKGFESTKFDKSEQDKIINTQDLLPWADISRNRIDMGDNRYVAILKVQPYNYMIQSESGKDSFAIRLRRAYNSMNFKTYLFTHTRKMVNERMLNHLSETIDDTIANNRDQKDYADEYFRHLSVINIQNAETGALRKVKDYYILVPWEPSEDHSGMSQGELKIVADEELRSRLSQTKESLTQAGINSDFLNTVEIIELLTSIYRREESNRADLLFDQTYLATLVEGDKESLSVSDQVKLTSILEGALNQINQEIISSNKVDGQTRRVGIKSFEYISKLEEKVKNS